jgi:hypothetical protein
MIKTKRENSAKNSDGLGILYVFYVIGILMIFFMVYISYKVLHNRSSKLVKVLSVISGISVLIITFNLFFQTYLAHRDIYEKNAKTTLEIVNRNGLNIYKLFSDSLPYSYNLYVETHPDVKFRVDKHPEHQLKDPHLIEAHELTISTYLIQCMEDFLTIGKYDKTGSEIWITVFLGWLQSDTLVRYYYTMDDSYSIDAQEFINDMIEKAQMIKKMRSEGKEIDYYEIAKTVKYHFR